MIPIYERSRRLRKPVGLFIGVGSVLLFAACASTPPAPDVALSSAQQAIAAADQQRVADTSYPTLSEARDKLAEAQTAVTDKRMADAARLADEARVDALLATAQIQQSKDQAVNDEMVQSTRMLTEEMQRNSGATQ